MTRQGRSAADTDQDGTVDTRIYRVRGELFFASSNDLVYQFDYVDDPRNVVIDLTGADIWDASTVATLDSIRRKYASKGKHIEIIGLDGASLDRLDRLSGRLGDSHLMVTDVSTHGHRRRTADQQTNEGVQSAGVRVSGS